MKIILKSNNLPLTPQLEDYLQKKIKSLEKFLKNFNEETIKAEVEVGKTTRHHKHGFIFRAEINLSADGKFFRAAEEKDDIYAAIDEVRDELEEEIKKFKTKRGTIFLRGARSLKKRFSLSPFSRFRKNKK